MVESRRIEFIGKGKPSEDQRLATETCPGFTEAEGRAFSDYWEIKGCRKPGCPVEVKFIPHRNVLQVKGSCPKL